MPPCAFSEVTRQSAPIFLRAGPNCRHRTHQRECEGEARSLRTSRLRFVLACSAVYDQDGSVGQASPAGTLAMRQCTLQKRLSVRSELHEQHHLPEPHHRPAHHQKVQQFAACIQRACGPGPACLQLRWCRHLRARGSCMAHPLLCPLPPEIAYPVDDLACGRNMPQTQRLVLRGLVLAMIHSSLIVARASQRLGLPGSQHPWQ